MFRASLVGAALSLVPVAVVSGAGRRPAAPGPPSGGPPVAYVANRQGTQALVGAVNTVTKNSGPTVPVASMPTAIAITPDARFALAALDGQLLFSTSSLAAFPGQSAPPLPPEVVAIDVATNRVVARAPTRVDAAPVAIAVTPDGTMAFVANRNRLATDTVTPITIGTGGNLTVGDAFPLTGRVVADLAVSPDGKDLYVAESASGPGPSLLETFAVSGHTRTGALPIAGVATSMVLSPDGSTAYVALGSCDCSAPLAIDEVMLKPKQQEIAQIPLPTGRFSPNPVDLAIAYSPAGAATLYAADQNQSSVVPIPLPVPKGFQPSVTVTLPGPPTDLAATPDGSELEVTISGGQVVSVDTAAGKAKPCPSGGCPAGSGPIAVTPDQRPVAAFSATPLVAGQATSFDASASTIAYGAISGYAWDFGDGSRETKAAPTTTHVYASPGTYTVALTETDAAGASTGTSPPSTIFTGQTMTRRGGPPARVTVPVVVPSVPTSPSPTSAKPGPTSPALTPKIAVSPELGPPGIVVAATGSGFPSNTPVTLVWNPGIGSATVTTDGHGAFKRFILVFEHDRLGDRLLQAQGFTATATFLVVPAPVAPPGGHDVQLLFRH